MHLMLNMEAYLMQSTVSRHCMAVDVEKAKINELQ